MIFWEISIYDMLDFGFESYELKKIECARK